MSMLDLTKTELDSHQALIPKVNSLTQRVMNTIPFPNVPNKMKATVAISVITAFASQFRRNVELEDGTSVPINTIGFVLVSSGGGKDSSVRAAKKAFKPGYQILHNEIEKQVRTEAIRAAAEAGEECPDEYAIYKAYLKPIPPVDTSVTTGPGLIKLINDTADLPLGANLLYSGEFSDELAYNADMIENIKILSEVYDLGIKEMTYTKGVEFRSKAIDGQAVSALFVGSPGHILYDEATKKKFQIAFMSKLARRSWFCYEPNRIPEPTFSSNDEFIEYETQLDRTAAEACAMLTDLVKDVTTHNIARSTTPIRVTPEVTRLFKIYKRYNSDFVDSLPNQESTYSLIRRHLQWKALKLAGAFALFDKSNTIKLTHYIEAIQFCELLDQDMNMFEHDLNKSYHERFADFVRTQVVAGGKATISIHDIKKQGFLSNVSKPKLQELITLSAAYDTDGIYTIIGDGSAIQYEPIIRTDVIGISFKPINNDNLNAAVAAGDPDQIAAEKKSIAMSTAYGFEVAETTFSELSDLLSGDFAYSPFKFRNGVRGKENLIGGTKWLVLDIDDSVVSAGEMHFMLMDINHHVALSSDPSNDYKFRILIELDSVVELNPIQWKHFYLAIADDLAIKADPLPQSQVFFSYADRPVLSQLEANPLPVRDYVMQAIEVAQAKEASKPKLTPAQVRLALSDPESTFHYAFNAPNGAGSRSLIRAAYHAKDLGADREQTLQLIHDINEFWESPMPDERFEAILQQVSRMF